MKTESLSAVIVRVAEADAHVDALRQRYDPSVAFGVPAHVTVLYPFLTPAELVATVLQRLEEAVQAIEPFDFELHETRRFPGIVYLAPRPHQPFVALTRAIEGAFPALTHYGGRFDDVVPHLTVASGDASHTDAAEAELCATMSRRGPVKAHCRSIEVMENSSGLWRLRCAVPLGIEAARSQAR